MASPQEKQTPPQNPTEPLIDPGMLNIKCLFCKLPMIYIPPHPQNKDGINQQQWVCFKCRGVMSVLQSCLADAYPPEDITALPSQPNIVIKLNSGAGPATYIGYMKYRGKGKESLPKVYDENIVPWQQFLRKTASFTLNPPPSRAASSATNQKSDDDSLSAKSQKEDNSKTQNSRSQQNK